MTKIVSTWLIICILTTQLWWRPDSIHTDDIVSEAKSQVDLPAQPQGSSCEDQDQLANDEATGDCDEVDEESDSQTDTPNDKPINPILARAALPDQFGRLTRPISLSKVLALSIQAQAPRRQRDPRGANPERVAASARCRTASLLANARAIRPHAPPLT